MTWRYIQSTGRLHDPSGKPLAIGYSGHGAGLNNATMQSAVGIGPIPSGTYRIGPPHTPVDHLGPLALPLIPDPANEMFGRSGFFTHGDNDALNHTASNGCLILPRGIRLMMNDSTDRELAVVADETKTEGTTT